MSKNFEELLAELNGVASGQEEIAKSIAATPAQADDDETIAAAAADAGVEAPAAPAADGGDAGDLDDDPDEAVLGKSFEVLNDKGEKEKAFDATELIKSMLERQTSTEETLAKALTGFTSVIKQQGEMIKSLSDKVGSLSAQGRGRKAVLTVSEKPDAVMAKSDGANEGITPSEFFAKANAAFDEGRLSGKDLNVISVCLRSNQPVDESLIKQVLKV